MGAARLADRAGDPALYRLQPLPRILPQRRLQPARHGDAAVDRPALSGGDHGVPRRDAGLAGAFRQPGRRVPGDDDRLRRSASFACSGGGPSPDPPLFHRGMRSPPTAAIAGEVSWSLVGVFANHVETRSYAYIATSMVGLAALAAINIVGVLFRPITVLMNAWAKTTLPQLSAQCWRAARSPRSTGCWPCASPRPRSAASRGIWRSGRLLGPGRALRPRRQISRSAALLLPWAAASAASVLRYVAGIGLIAARRVQVSRPCADRLRRAGGGGDDR